MPIVLEPGDEPVEEELRRKPAKLVALVHAETSTGAWQPVADVARTALARRLRMTVAEV